MRITVKTWFYENEQNKAGKYNFTLVWKANYNEYDEKVSNNFYGKIVKETEKAIQCELLYWNLNRAERYITDAPMVTGWKTWIPKSVILETKNVSVREIYYNW